MRQAVPGTRWIPVAIRWPSRWKRGPWWSSRRRKAFSERRLQDGAQFTSLSRLRQTSDLGKVTAGLGWDVKAGPGPDVDLVPRLHKALCKGSHGAMGRAVGRFRGVLRRGRAAPGSRVLRKPGVWESGVQVQIPEALTELWSGQEEFGVVHSGDNLTGALLQTHLHASG